LPFTLPYSPTLTYSTRSSHHHPSGTLLRPHSNSFPPLFSCLVPYHGRCLQHPPALRLLHSHTDLEPPLDRCRPRHLQKQLCAGAIDNRVCTSIHSRKSILQSGSESKHRLRFLPSLRLFSRQADRQGTLFRLSNPIQNPPPAVTTSKHLHTAALLDLTESRVQSVAAACDS
jgi:hypothetical protein